MAACATAPVTQASASTPLIEVASKGDIATVQTLLAQGANVNEKDKDGRTALMWAAFNGHTAIVEVLLAKGAEMNAKDNEYGWTALMVAARNGHTATVEALLTQGADVHAKDKDGKTALQLAESEGHTHIAQLLKKLEEKRR